MQESSENVKQEAPNYALVNSVRGQDIYNAIKVSMKDIASFLSQFNGPFALNAATVAQSTHTTVDQFTKDGVTILSRMSAGCPQDELSRRLIEFIGQKVDSRCHDGTTTSMMMAASLAYHWMDILAPKTRRERHQLANTIRDIVDHLDRCVENQSFTIDEFVKDVLEKYPDVPEEKIRERIFYDTIMTSSKGDSELARKLTEVLLTLPEELYNYTRFENSILETDERFQVITQECDVQLKGNYIGNFTLLRGNEDMGSTFSMDKAHLIISSNELLDNQAESVFLEQWIKNQLLPSIVINDEGQEKENPPRMVLDRPIVILARNIQSRLVTAVNIYNSTQEEWDKKIFLYQYHAEHDLSYDAWSRAIPAMAGSADKEYYSLNYALSSHGDLTKVMIPCRFWACANLIELFDLYPRDDRKFHPFYYDKSKTRYHDLIKEMKDTIEKNSQRHLDVSKKLERFAYDLIYIQRCMICQTIKEMRVSSSTHELFANITVVEDALGSAMSVVEEGVILSGYQKMIIDIMSRPATPIAKSTVNAINDVLKAAFDLDDKTFDASYPSMVLFKRNTETKYLYVNAFDEAPFTPRDALSEIANGTSNAVFQPKAGYKEQLLRIKDIISKLVMTYSLLTHKSFDREFGK